MPVFRLLQPLPNDFRLNDVTSGSLPVTWGHVMSFPVTWLSSPASYSPVEVKRKVYASFRHSTTTSRFPVKGRQFRPLRSRDVISCHVTASCKLQLCRKSNTVYASFRPSIATSRWLQVKLRHFRVTSGHLRSLDAISCHVTASSCKLQTCRKSISICQFSSFYSYFQGLPVKWRNFQSLPVSWGHVTSFPVTWLPPLLSYSLVGSETQSMRDVGLQQPLQGDFRSNDVSSGALPVTWGHVTSFPVTWRLLQATVL